MRGPGLAPYQITALLLGLAAGFEWFIPLAPGTLPSVVVSMPQRAPGSPSHTVVNWQQIVLGRPLFRPDRRPVTAPAQATPLPRLSGILIGAGTKLALFADDQGTTIMAAPGATVGAYRISNIETNEVTLVAPGVKLVLRPHFASGLAPTDNTGSDPTDPPDPPPPTHVASPNFANPGRN